MRNVFVFDSSLHYSSNTSQPHVIIMRNIILQNTSVTLRNNAMIYAVNCSFQNSSISDDITSNSSQSYIEITLDGCEFLCQNNAGHTYHVIKLNKPAVIN